MFNKIYDKTKKLIKENLWFLISLIFIIFIFNFELPYYIEAPGGFISLNDRIKLNDSKLSGEFGMAYVTMIKGSIPFLGLSYLNDTWDIIKKDDIKYDNETLNDMNKREKLYLNEAIDQAKIVAYTYANKQLAILDTKLYITYLNNSDTELKLFDIIKEIDGTKINNLSDIQSVIENTTNDYVSIKIIRDNEEKIVKSSIQNIDGRRLIGIMVTPNYDIKTDPEISVDVKNNESGSSGGLMMALDIYSKISGDDLTKGDKIIGTGTINIDGSVGPIGGIKYKLIGAVKSGAKVFLCPLENYEEAQKLKNEKNYDIIIYNVTNFSEAVAYLKGR